jgi:segregation and condensation protein B
MNDSRYEAVESLPESVFALEGDTASSPETATRALEEHRASGKSENTIFGLDNDEEENQEMVIPSELIDEEMEGNTESPTFKINVSATESKTDGEEEITESPSFGIEISGTVVEKSEGAGCDSDTPLIMDLDEAKQIIETLLFAAHEALRPRDISMVFRGVGNVNAKVVRNLLAELKEEYQDRTLQITEVAEGFRMCTRMEFSHWLRRFLKQEKNWRVSNAGLETLAIVAYKQPITKMEVEDVRRVDCGGAIHTLLERKMIRILGRRDVAGKPIVYGTTLQFLEHFGFRSLTDMPRPEEFDLNLDLEKQGMGNDVILNEEESSSKMDDNISSELVKHQANGLTNVHAYKNGSGMGNDHATTQLIEEVGAYSGEDEK